MRGYSQYCPIEVVTAQDESFAVLVERLMRLLRMVAVNAAIVMAELAPMPCRMPGHGSP